MPSSAHRRAGLSTGVAIYEPKQHCTRRRHWHRPFHINRLGGGERDDRLLTERSRPGNDGAKDKTSNVARTGSHDVERRMGARVQ